MRSALSVVLAIVAALLFATPGPASASPATDAFDVACKANPGFFSFAVEGLEANSDDLGRICLCLVTGFTALSDKDLLMLTHDVDGTATAEERTAFGDYTGLELRARDALDKCLVAEGFSDGVEPPPAEPAQPTEPADMTKFDAACTASQGLLGVIGGTPEQATPLRAVLCKCLTTTLMPQVSTADADILAMDLDDTATDESRAAYPGYADLTNIAGAAFNGCFSTLRPAE